MKKKFKHLSIAQRMIVLILVTIVICFIINGLLFVPMPSHADDNAWLGFYGRILGATIAGIVTLWAIETTIKSTLMNFKPVIRPVKSYFYVYTSKEKGSMVITDTRLVEIFKEHCENDEIDFEELDIYMVIEAYAKIEKKYEGTKWSLEVSKLDVEKLYEEIFNICKHRNINKCFKLLFEELADKYKNEINKSIIEDIIYELKKLYRRESERKLINNELEKWDLFFPIYNIGAGNALDIEVNWDVSDLAYKNICDELGFNENDYDEMNKSFSFKNMELLKKEILLCEKDSNKINIVIPGEIVLLIKFIIKKSEDNYSIKNNILVKENKIAQLTIRYDNIHGETLEDKYNVYFKIWSNIIDEYDDYNEKTFYFRFVNTEKE